MQRFSGGRSLAAMLWELWRVSRFELLIRFAFVSAIILLIFSLSKGLDEIQVQVIRGIVLMLLGITCAFSTTWTSDLDNQHSGFTFRLGYTRPVSTLQLVLVPMAYSVATAMLGYIVCALVAQVVLSQSMPLMGPALLFGSVVCVLICAAWSSTQTMAKIVGITLASIAIVGALLTRHELRPGNDPILLAIGKPEYFQFAGYEYLSLLGISLISATTTVWAVGRQRCGESLSWSIVPASVIRALLSQRRMVAARNWIETGTRPKAFRSPVVAQFWFEVRRSGHLGFVVSL